MKKLALFTCAAVLLGASSAYAAGPQGGDGPGPNTTASTNTSMADQMIVMMDTDGDGMVSKTEHDTAKSKMFTDADTNGDGNLSKEEITAAHAAMETKSHM